MVNPYSPYAEPGFVAWQQRLGSLPPSEVTIRTAEPTAEDGCWLRWIQADCEAIYIHSVEDNVAKIGRQLVLLAEVANCPVGFCYALAGHPRSSPLFIQLVAVVPSARRRGAGLALLGAAAGYHPQRDIAGATLDDNIAARSLNERFAQSIGGEIQSIPLSRFRRSDLGFARSEGHRPWMIARSQ